MTPEQARRAREIGLFALALVLVAIAGYGAGRFSAPVEVETREVWHVEWREKKVETVKKRTARAVDTRTTTTPVLIATPDGGVILATTTLTETRRRDETDLRSSSATDTISLTEGETSRKVTQLPGWRVGLQAGASLRDPLLPLAGPLVLGVAVERRIVGGVSLGAWANTVGAAGASVSLELP